MASERLKLPENEYFLPLPRHILKSPPLSSPPLSRQIGALSLTPPIHSFVPTLSNLCFQSQTPHSLSLRSFRVIHCGFPLLFLPSASH